MFATQDARQDDAALRVLMQGAGIWPQIRSRPFGRLPTTDEAPAAIFVMLLDARPGAPCPGAAVKDRTPDLEAGLDALCRLTPGPVFLCQSPGAETVGMAGRKANLRLLKTALHYPRALPGFLAHQHFPALPDRPIWDIHGEDAAGLGMLLRSGMIPETRRVRIGGPALTRSLTVDCQPGADLRGLCQGLVAPGAHRLLTGPAMGGNPARWLGTRDRQVCALPDMAAPRRDHWFFAALRRAARPLPLIPTAALEQAMGGVLPAMPFLRALSAGDQETAQRLGALSFLEEDLALADYISGAKPPLSSLLRVLLDRVAAERQT
jgi:Na+-transporting NADH:ubiquinone oxidoreductase subunit A